MIPRPMMAPTTAAPATARSWSRAALSIAAVTAIGLAAGACSSNSKHSLPGAASSSASNRGTPIAVAMDNNRYGTILTTSSGFALYIYTADDPGGPGCTGECLKLWPPLLLPAGTAQPSPGPGVSGLGTFARSGGLQVTFKGLPLYTYVKDKTPGQITGNDVVDAGGKWLLAIESPTAALPASTTTTPLAGTTAPATNPTAATTAPTTTPATAATTPYTQAPPATEAPVVTAPPRTSPPVTSPPATHPPATYPPPTTPTTSPPTTSPPTTAPGGLPSY